jgi:HNH endonuclease
VAQLVELIRAFERGRRFWRGVDVRGREECWLWSGGPAPHGGADVHAYERMHGPLPPRTRLVHTCGNARCVNPDHMVVVDAD